MRSALLAALALLLVPRVLTGQRIEWQVHGVAIVTGSEYRGGGVGLGYRTPGRLRLGVAAALGQADSVVAGRGEAALAYHVNPFGRRGLAPYVGGGLAVTVSEHTATEYLVVFLGVEANPGGTFGWFVEGGLAGGARFAVGLRLR